MTPVVLARVVGLVAVAWPAVAWAVDLVPPAPQVWGTGWGDVTYPAALVACAYLWRDSEITVKPRKGA